MLDFVLEEANRSLNEQIKKLGEQRKTHVLALYSEINRGLVEGLQAYAKTWPSDRPKSVDVILESGGGDIDAAYHLAKVLSDLTPETLTFIVPRWAKSAATLLACGGDQIIMCPAAELGPLDPQVQLKDGTYVSALAVKATLGLLDKTFKEGKEEVATVLSHNMDPLSLGDIERSLSVSQQYLKILLKNRMFKGTQGGKIKKIGEKLTTGYTHHSYLIDLTEAKRLGLKVNNPAEQELGIIMNIHIAQRRILEFQAANRMLVEAEILKKLQSGELVGKTKKT